MNWEKENSIGNLFIVLITIMALSTLSKIAFHIYTEYSLYIMLVYSMLVIFMSGNMLKGFFMFIIIFFAYLIYAVAYSGGGFGSILTALLFLLILNSYTYFDLKESICRYLVMFSSFLILFLFIRSFAYAEDFYYYRYNSINQNTMSMYIIYFFMIRFTVLDLNNKAKTISTLVLFVISLIALQNYSARGCTISLIFFGCLNLIFRKKYSVNAILFITTLVVAFGIAFPAFYLSLYRNNIDFMAFGKNLYTGREAIWNNMFNALNQNKMNWLFGLGSKAILWKGHSLNVHNDYFGVMVNFGIIGFALYYGFIFKLVVKIAEIARYNRLARKGLFMYISGVLLLGSSEVTTMWTTIYPLVCFGLGIGCRIYKKSLIHKECSNDS